MPSRRFSTFFPLIILLISGLVCGGCSDGDPSGVETGSVPVLLLPDEVRIDLPPALDAVDNPYAEQLCEFVRQENETASLVNLLQPPAMRAEDESGPPWETIWTVDTPPYDLEIRMVTDLIQDDYIWNCYWTGTDGIVQYEGQMVMHGRAVPDCSVGSFQYEPIGAAMKYLFWQCDSFGDELIEFYTTEAQQDPRKQFRVHPDGSGSLIVYTGIEPWWTIAMAFNWDANGNGNWYDKGDGSQSEFGYWLVPSP